MKINWKAYFKSKLYIVGFIFALIGWFLIFAMVIGPFFMAELGSLESTLRSKAFIWGLRILIFALVLIAVKGREWISGKLEKYPVAKTVLKVIYIGGVVGWVIGLGLIIFF